MEAAVGLGAFAMETLSIVRADGSHLDLLALLFDAYRRFYGQPGDIAAARDFLAERLAKGDSVVLIARLGPHPVGFAQLYPTHSSVAMRRVWVLNDLFVQPENRRHGVGGRLLEAAAEFGRREGAVRLALATASGNNGAKSLYESHGWGPDRSFDHYVLPLPPPAETPS